MKSVLLAVALALGAATLAGCGSSNPTQPAGAPGGAPPPDNSGADAGAKKGGGRIPPAPK